MKLNLEQRKILANFFIGLAIAWAIATFIDINADSKSDILKELGYFVNMILAVMLALFLVKDN